MPVKHDNRADDGRSGVAPAAFSCAPVVQLGSVRMAVEFR